MIVDVHGHLIRNPEDLDWIANRGVVEKVWLHALPELAELYHPDQPDLVFGIDSEVLEAARQYPDLFLPFGYLDLRKPPEAIDAQREAGFVGLKAIFAARPYDDDSYMPHYERAQALGMPILFHMGGLGPVREAQLGEGLSAKAGNMRPCQLFTIAGNFPDLQIVGAHLGDVWQAEVLEGLRGYPNLYFDISGGDTYKYLTWLLDNLGHDQVPGKILAGIDTAYGRHKYHENLVDRVKFWELFFGYLAPWFKWTDEAEMILRGNAARIHATMGVEGQSG